MSYVDRNLLPGETVVFRSRLHWKVYIPVVLVDLVLFLPLAVLALVYDRKPLAILPAVAALLALLPPHLKRQSSEFAVTSKRVIIKLGVLSTRSIELLLSKVEAIAVTQTFTGRLLGYGGIVVTGSGGTREAFQDIEAPLEFRQAVQAATDARPSPGGGAL